MGCTAAEQFVKSKILSSKQWRTAAENVANLVFEVKKYCTAAKIFANLVFEAKKGCIAAENFVKSRIVSSKKGRTAAECL